MAMTTNAVRILEGKGIRVEVRTYVPDADDLSAGEAAEKLGLDPWQVFKTLVTRCGKNVVLACIPGPAELDLKRLASVTGQKTAEMVHLSEVFPLTGYVRGGVSPVGSRKCWPVVLDRKAMDFGRICVSAGARGVQILLSPSDLQRASGASVALISRERTKA